MRYMKAPALACFLLTSGLAIGQQEPVASEAASVKMSHSPTTGMGGAIGFMWGGRVSMRNVTAKFLVGMAYGLPDYRLSGGPAWASTIAYDIEAKPEKAVDQKTAMLMLQALLADRFGLRVHHEESMVTGYNLVVDAGSGDGRRRVPHRDHG